MSTTRPHQGEARAAILEAADRLFYHNGIRAVGVDTIAAEAGITKRTLYYHFPTKEVLINAYLTERDQKTRERLLANAAHAGPLVGDRIVSIFDFFTHWFASDDYAGCPFLDAMASKTDSVCGRVTEHKEAIYSWLVDELTGARVNEPDSLAEQLMLLIDGALSRSSYRGSEAAHYAQVAAATLLRIAGVPISQSVDISNHVEEEQNNNVLP